jgi:hypothetical protein
MAKLFLNKQTRLAYSDRQCTKPQTIQSLIPTTGADLILELYAVDAAGPSTLTSPTSSISSNAKPINGTVSLTYNAVSLGEIDINATEQEWNTYLNANAAIATDGGFEVILGVGSLIIRSREVGTGFDTLAVGSSDLAPFGTAILTQTQSGDADERAVWTLRFELGTLAVQNTFTQTSAVGATITTLMDGSATVAEVERIVLTGEPVSGYWSISTSTGNTAPIRFDAGCKQVEAAMNAKLGSGIVVVTSPAPWTFDIAWQAYGTVTALTATTSGLTGLQKSLATLSLDTVEAESFPNELQADFQITDSTEVIYSEKLSLTVLNNVGDVPVTRVASYVRYDASQTLTAGQKLQAVTNQGLNLTASKLLGQASSGGTGLPVAITLGTGLSMSGTTLNSSGGIGGSTGSTDNAILRADGTGGSTAQGTSVILDDLGGINGVVLRYDSIDEMANLADTVGQGFLALIPSGLIARFSDIPNLGAPGAIGATTPSTGEFTTLKTTGDIELGNANDTTLSRVSAGKIAVEGVNVVTASSTDTLTNKTLTSPTLTTPTLGTPASGTLTNCTGTAASLTAGQATAALGIKSATTTVAVDSATAPSSGQVLTATSTTAATWQTPSSGGTPGGSTTQIQLNNAGAFGGVAGLTASLSSGAITQTQTALGTTPLAGATLTNTTAAAAGAQQVSPATVWTGRGWKTTATAASQEVSFRAYTLPVQGSTNPTGTWALQSSINGGAWTDMMTVTSGNVASATTFQAGNSSFNNSGFQAGNASFSNTGFASGLSSGTFSLANLAFLSWGGTTGNLRQGAYADVAAPVAQTFSVQSVSAGTTNTAGVNRIISGSQGTGTGVGGDILFQCSQPGVSSSSQNALYTNLTIKGDGFKSTQASGPVIFAAYTVSTLPTASLVPYARAFVTDASVGLTAGIGTTVASGGSLKVPVYSDGTSWIIG